MASKQIKTGVEIINSELITIIKKPFDAVAVRKSLAVGVPVAAFHKRYGVVSLLPYKGLDLSGTHFTLWLYDADAECLEDCVHCCPDSDFTHTLTILPALPKHPKTEYAALLYRYMAEGLYPYGLGKGSLVHADDWLVDHRIDAVDYPLEIKGAHDVDGNRVDVAIKGK